jgi:hypothetical protein
MPAPLAATRIAAERQSIDEIDRHLERLDAKLRDALLLTNNEDEVAQLDADIASLKRKAEHHKLRIDSLRANQVLEQRATAAKQKAQLIARVESKIDELRETVAAFQKKQAEAIKLHRKWQDLAIECATAWPWGPSNQNACGFNLDEITRDTRHELCRIGSGQLLHAGAIQRPSFPGGLNPKLELLHNPGAITPLIDTIDQRLGLARKVLHANLPVTETERKAS